MTEVKVNKTINTIITKSAFKKECNDSPPDELPLYQADIPEASIDGSH
jgi:hypothetical protein